MNDLIRIYAAVSPAEAAQLYDESTRRRLCELGEVTWAQESEGAQLPYGVADRYDVLITSWSTMPFHAQALRGKRLRLIVHSAGSVRNLFPRDVLGERVRLVQGGADAMAVPVAEMAVTLTLALLRNLHTHDRGLQRDRNWDAAGHGMLGRGIQGLRIGVLGLSRTGRHYVRMVRGMGARHLSTYDPYLDAAEARSLGIALVDLPTLCSTSDILAVHAPATPKTRHLINAEHLSSLPDGAVIVNTARSAVVDEGALTDELVSGRLKAGLDVFDIEPLPYDHPLYGLPNVILTPHVAGGTVDARFRQGEAVAAEINSFLSLDPPRV